MPVVSVCLTTFNRAPLLRASIESILAQSFGDLELIISDDCSTDATQEICIEYAGCDSRVRYSRNAKNLRMPGNLNSAISRARGAYIANLHDGDTYRPDLIERWKAALDDLPEAPFVFNSYEMIGPDGSSRLCREDFSHPVPGERIAWHYFRHVSSCIWGTVMARASAYERAGPFDPQFGFISDVDMWLRMSLGTNVAYIDEPLIVLTPREESHPYYYAAWDYLFWQFGIYARHWPRYQHLLPPEQLPSYKIALRNRYIRSLFSLIKHRRWSRVREGLAIFRDADDPMLRLIGRAFGDKKNLPAWYGPVWWQRIQAPEPVSAPCDPGEPTSASAKGLGN